MTLRDVLVTKTGDAGVLKVPVAHWGDGIVKREDDPLLYPVRSKECRHALLVSSLPYVANLNITKKSLRNVDHMENRHRDQAGPRLINTRITGLTLV
jgi:hypothetical protein